MSGSLSLLLSSTSSLNWGVGTFLRDASLPSSSDLFPTPLSEGYDRPVPAGVSISQGGAVPSECRQRWRDTGGGSSSAASDEVAEARGRSTLPKRFRNLNKEAPDRPLRWPWLVALGFLAYAWRAVLWELSNWRNAAAAVVGSAGYLSKLLFGLLYRLIGPPITAILWCRSSCGPVAELLWIIALTSAVMAAAEAASPGSVNGQRNLLTAAGVLGYAAVGGTITGLLFWPLLKKDAVEAALPPAALLAAVGSPWLRAVAMAAFLGVAVLQNSRSPAEEVAAGGDSERAAAPVPLRLAGLAVGIHLAARWLRYRHLTWMIV
ncbi:unnamed protein product [Spirodela intermedia]|uniref:Uncharacterized protein n=1 Tax=Spirodela intermedia TaxID=51605 RepID=A0A7I8JPC8_SPIIN|nr:unnamed protein product [Spirodela intermedia]CAA6672028.1 unnamed protein product [Spirodela intermedia]